MRPSSTIMPVQVHSEMVIRAQMHLELYLQGSATVDHMRTVASFFNLCSVLSAYLRDPARQEMAHRSLDFIAEAVRSTTGDTVPRPGPEAENHLRLTMNALDRWLALQNFAAIQKAIAYLNRSIQGKTSISVESVFNQPPQPRHDN